MDQGQRFHAEMMDQRTLWIGSVEELRDKGFEHVYVELERYDGPVTGLADVGGVPHYFSRDHDLSTDDHYFVWPADGARRLVAEWSFADDLDERWAPDGADYLVRWREPVGLDRS